MNALREIDWFTILIWGALSAIGLVAIYSATQGPVSQFLPEYIQNNFSRQLLWVSLSLVGIVALQFVPPRTFQGLSWILYAISLLLMVLTVFFGTEVSGSRSWLRIGP
ncbi:MAG: FtsW/RodA/SpoVE family cell cycle protein, partial [Bacteroidota bacterium]